MTQLRLTDLHTRRGRSGRPWERVKAIVYREETHCWLCGHWVDQTLHHQEPMARSADHLVQLAHGGNPLARTNLRLAHRRCNTIRGNKLRHVKQDHCACSQGQPCAPPLTAQRTPRSLSVDARKI